MHRKAKIYLNIGLSVMHFKKTTAVKSIYIYIEVFL